MCSSVFKFQLEPLISLKDLVYPRWSVTRRSVRSRLWNHTHRTATPATGMHPRKICQFLSHKRLWVKASFRAKTFQLCQHHNYSKYRQGSAYRLILISRAFHFMHLRNFPRYPNPWFYLIPSNDPVNPLSKLSSPVCSPINKYTTNLGTATVGHKEPRNCPKLTFLRLSVAKTALQQSIWQKYLTNPPIGKVKIKENRGKTCSQNV